MTTTLNAGDHFTLRPFFSPDNAAEVLVDLIGNATASIAVGVGMEPCL